MKNSSQKIAEKYFNKWFSHLENRVVCNSNLLISSFVFRLLRIFTAIKYSARLCQQKKIFEVAWEINVNLVKEDLSRVPKNNPQTTAKGCVTRIRCCVTRIRWAFWTSYLGWTSTKYFSNIIIRCRLYCWKQSWNPILRKFLRTPDSEKVFYFSFWWMKSATLIFYSKLEDMDLPDGKLIWSTI